MKTKSANSQTSSSALSSQNFDLVCFSHLRWDFVYQRPQHLLSRCAREHRVFYVEEPLIDAGPSRLVIQPQADNLWVVVPHLAKTLGKEESRTTHIQLINQFFTDQALHTYILWYYTPLALPYTRQLSPQLIIYDCMDELSAFKDASPLLKSYESELFQIADLIFTGGQSLYEAKHSLHPNVHLFPSSIDRDHFARARTLNGDPFDQASIPHPRIGFFGVIDERMDLNLIETLALNRPDWHIILIGPVAKIDEKKLPRHTNLHYLGRKTYQDLPGYLAGWDAAILPFALNESTRYISPTKTPEYLAGGKPVVSTPIRDVIRPYGEQQLVQIAENSSEFIQALESALTLNQDKELWLNKIDHFLNQNSWDLTWNKMRELIDCALTQSPHLAHAESIAPPLPDRNKSRPHYHSCPEKFDFLIVGAGFAGAVLAERLARASDKKVLVIDRRSHIGGNAYDRYNEAGIMIQKYGPHIFHTHSHEVFQYLSRFTEWRPYEHRVLASVDGQLLPIPINLDTINGLYGLNLTAFELKKFLESVAEPRNPIVTSEDVVISQVGRELYEKFFRHYTTKQWGLDPSQLDASVAARIPVRYNRDNRYFNDPYQAMPIHGLTSVIEAMLDHPNIKIMLNTDYRDINQMIPYRELIYSGPIDEFFNYCYGKLPYRTMQFKFETFTEPYHQPVAVVNYPNEHLYTRVTEFKYLTGQKHAHTTIAYEYASGEGDPYYPIPRAENQELYKRYRELAQTLNGVYFVGRLGTYRYYNMDQVVAQALTLYAKLAGIPHNDSLHSAAGTRPTPSTSATDPVLLKVKSE